MERGSHGSPKANANERGFLSFIIGNPRCLHPRHPRSNRKRENNGLSN